MQAIETKFLPATNHKGARIKATCERGSVTISYPYELSGEECHRSAVRALVEKFILEDEKTYQTPAIKNPWLAYTFGPSGATRKGYVFLSESSK